VIGSFEIGSSSYLAKISSISKLHIQDKLHIQVASRDRPKLIQIWIPDRIVESAVVPMLLAPKILPAAA